jgi:hypothetical protein
MLANCRPMRARVAGNPPCVAWQRRESPIARREEVKMEESLCMYER